MHFRWSWIFVALACASTPPGVQSAEYVIDTVAGTGRSADNGSPGPALETNLGEPFGVEIAPDGSLYITEVRNHRVWRLDLRHGDVQAVAGRGERGYSGDGGPATQATLNEPYEVRFDRQGNMYFVEMRNHIVRRVEAATGVISTVAGIGLAGDGGDGGYATNARLNQPHSIALDEQGRLYVADIGNHRIRAVDLRTGRIDSVAGAAQPSLPSEGQRARGTPVLGPRALYIRGQTMWVALREGHSVWQLHLELPAWQRVAGTGTPGRSGDGGRPRDATFNGPKGIAVADTGEIFVADTENHAIRAIDPDRGTIRLIAGGTRGAAGDGGPAVDAQLDRPHGICVAPDGTVYVGDTMNHRVRRLRPIHRPSSD